MPQSSLRIRQLPHYRIAASELAKWVENQGEDSWWSVDGDPVLTQRLDLPCPSEELAAELRRVGKPLIVLDWKEHPQAHGETISFAELDSIAHKNHYGDRVFQLCWEEGPNIDWLLVEDKETSESSLGLDDDRE